MYFRCKGTLNVSQTVQHCSDCLISTSSLQLFYLQYSLCVKHLYCFSYILLKVPLFCSWNNSYPQTVLLTVILSCNPATKVTVTFLTMLTEMSCVTRILYQILRQTFLNKLYSRSSHTVSKFLTQFFSYWYLKTFGNTALILTITMKRGNISTKCLCFSNSTNP